MHIPYLYFLSVSWLCNIQYVICNIQVCTKKNQWSRSVNISYGTGSADPYILYLDNGSRSRMLILGIRLDRNPKVGTPTMIVIENLNGKHLRKRIECWVPVFPEKELRGFSPYFHIHVSVRDLYIPRIGPPIFLQQNRQTDCRNIYKSLTDT